MKEHKVKAIKKIYLSKSFEYDHDVARIIEFFMEQEEYEIITLDYKAYRLLSEDQISDQIEIRINECDLLLIFIIEQNEREAYKVGVAKGMGKPVVAISINETYNSFYHDLIPVIYYAHYPQYKSLLEKIKDTVKYAIDNPTFSQNDITEELKNNVFISYSHKDRATLDRLAIHLKPLKDQKKIVLWEDTKLRAGDNWESEINKALEKSNVAILLISADFLASDFIINNELPPLLKRAELEGTRIIPLIIKPCRFKRDANLSVFQSINNPDEPLLLLDSVKQEIIYDQVSQLVESIVKY